MVKDMNKKVVFMYSGQGSQYYNMTEEIYKSNQVFRLCMDSFDRIVREKIGVSVVEELYNHKCNEFEEFDRLLYTNPLIFMIEYSLTQVILKKGIYPNYLLGSSLGVFTCMSVAEMVDPIEMIKALIDISEIVEKECEPGGMIAILEDYHIFYDSPMLYNNVEMITINSQSHFVVSGIEKNLSKAEAFLKSKRIIYVRLPVRYGFHSAGIDKAKKSIIFRSKEIEIYPPKFKIWNDVCYDQEIFWNIIREEINTPNILIKNKTNELIYLDLGIGGTMANIAKGIIGDSEKIYSIILRGQNENQKLDSINQIINANEGIKYNGDI